MPTAKPRYDGGGDWKKRRYSEAEWEDIGERIRKKLRPFYPDKNAKADPPFGHPADGWANGLLSEANSAVSTMLWLRLRLSKAELKAERRDLLKTLDRAASKLNRLSHDLDIMLGGDADIRGCRDKIKELMPRLEAAGAAIDRLPTARRRVVAEHEAAVEMAIRVLRILKSEGIPIPASGSSYFDYTPDAVKILKILGDELGLDLVELTWRDVIIDAKRLSPDLC